MSDYKSTSGKRIANKEDLDWLNEHCTPRDSGKLSFKYVVVEDISDNGRFKIRIVGGADISIDANYMVYGGDLVTNLELVKYSHDHDALSDSDFDVVENIINSIRY